MQKKDFKNLKLANDKMRKGEPIQFPKIIDKIEGNCKSSFNKQMDDMLVDVTKFMVALKK